jgi:uncharacterized protein
MGENFHEHESLCRRCGRCCYEKFIVDGRVFTLRKPCAHLDESTNLCKAYGERHDKNDRCLTVEQGIEWGVFPADCPYVKDLPDYLPAEEGWLDETIVKKIESGKLFNAEDILAEMKRMAKGK